MRIRSATRPSVWAGAITAALLLSSLGLSSLPVHAGEGPVIAPVPVTYEPNRSFAPLVEAVLPAVVSIQVEGAPEDGPARLPSEVERFFQIDPRSLERRPMRGEGSGFVVSADGLVLTNHHVIAQATSITAKFADGSQAKATVVGSDESLDIALLRLEGKEAWPFVELGSAKPARVGDWVIAVGNPLGLGHTVTAGIISGKGRTIGHDVYDDFLQTDAAINQGNSGGPMFDVNGKVIGINTAIVAGANTVGFAVPIDLVKAAMADLLKRGHVARGFVGVLSQPMDEVLAKSMGAKGALLAEVMAGAPAAKAGLTAGDVVTRVGNQTVTNPGDLTRAVGTQKPGEKIDVTFVRDGKEKTVIIELAERPLPHKPAAAAATPREEPAAATTTLGIDLRPVESMAAKALGVDHGVLVAGVDRGGAAARYLTPGDVILEVNRKPVNSPADVDAAVAKSGDTVLFLVERADGQRFVAVPLK